MEKKREKLVTAALRDQGPIKAVIYAMVRDFDATDEIFQETMVAIIESGDGYDESLDALPWMKGIARNAVRRYWERQNRGLRAAGQDALEALSEVAAEAGDVDLWTAEKQSLRICLKKLNTRGRELFLARYGENLKGRELAERVGINPNSIRTTLLRIREVLRKCIAGLVSAVPEGGAS